MVVEALLRLDDGPGRPQSPVDGTGDNAIFPVAAVPAAVRGIFQIVEKTSKIRSERFIGPRRRLRGTCAFKEHQLNSEM